MNNEEFCAKLLDIANNYNTLYVSGCFGAPLTAKNKKRYTNNNDYNRQADRTKMILNASEDTFGFDCVCLIKGILWGWCGDLNATYGGAKYRSNDVPDIGANAMILKCEDVTTDFTSITKGELVWIDGHVGVYVGEGKVVECTPKWENDVQISNLGNDSKYKTGHYRIWKKHGRLPYITYVTSATPTVNPAKKSNSEIAKDVIKGLWGNGKARKQKLKENGYDPLQIQILVNKMLLK